MSLLKLISILLYEWIEQSIQYSSYTCYDAAVQTECDAQDAKFWPYSLILNKSKIFVYYSYGTKIKLYRMSSKAIAMTRLDDLTHILLDVVDLQIG